MDARKKYMVARKALEDLAAAVETPDGPEKRGRVATAVAVAKAKLEVLFELDDEPAIDIAAPGECQELNVGDPNGFPEIDKEPPKRVLPGEPYMGDYRGCIRPLDVMWPPEGTGNPPWIRPTICSTGKAGKGGKT